MDPSDPNEAALNPYESPQEAGGYFPTESIGIAMWRDRFALVMQRGTTFPEICIETGQPAEYRKRFVLIWWYPIDWATRGLTVEVPFTRDGYRRFCRGRAIRAISIATAVCASLAASLVFIVGVLGTVFVVLPIFALITGFRLRERPLRFVRVRGQYLWFSGASSQFLARLPLWTSGSWLSPCFCV